MTDPEKKEHAELIAKWNATDITREQTERLEQLDAIASLAHHPGIPESAFDDREDIIHTLAEKMRIKYDHGQIEHKTDLPSGGLAWFVKAATEESLDLNSYHHHIGKKVEALHDLQQRMASGEISMVLAADELFTLISETPPRKHAG